MGIPHYTSPLAVVGAPVVRCRSKNFWGSAMTTKRDLIDRLLIYGTIAGTWGLALLGLYDLVMR